MFNLKNCSCQQAVHIFIYVQARKPFMQKIRSFSNIMFKIASRSCFTFKFKVGNRSRQESVHYWIYVQCTKLFMLHFYVKGTKPFMPRICSWLNLCSTKETVCAKKLFIFFMFNVEKCSCHDSVHVFYLFSRHKTVNVKNLFMFLFLFKVGNCSCLEFVYVLIYVRRRKPFMPWIPSCLNLYPMLETVHAKNMFMLEFYVQGRKPFMLYF
jgi:hypothetical protein